MLTSIEGRANMSTEHIRKPGTFHVAMRSTDDRRMLARAVCDFVDKHNVNAKPEFGESITELLPEDAFMSAGHFS